MMMLELLFHPVRFRAELDRRRNYPNSADNLRPFHLSLKLLLVIPYLNDYRTGLLVLVSLSEED